MKKWTPVFCGLRWDVASLIKIQIYVQWGLPLIKSLSLGFWVGWVALQVENRGVLTVVYGGGKMCSTPIA